MNTTNKEVDGSLGHPIRADGERYMLHAGNRSDTRRNYHKDGILRLLLQRQGGLVQTNHTCGIDIDVLHQVGRLHLGHSLKCGEFKDSGTGYYSVDVDDAVGREA